MWTILKISKVSLELWRKFIFMTDSELNSWRINTHNYKKKPIGVFFNKKNTLAVIIDITKLVSRRCFIDFFLFIKLN